MMSSDEWSLWDVGHHDSLVGRVKGGLAVIRFVSTVVLAAWTFVLWTIVQDMSKKMTYSARIVMIFRARVVCGVEVSLFCIPESPF